VDFRLIEKNLELFLSFCSPWGLLAFIIIIIINFFFIFFCSLKEHYIV
jgi:hypothetical protein